MARRSLLAEELAAVTETGLYESEEEFLSDAVGTLLAARPDLREAIACRLYQKGVFSLGKAAEWAGLSIEDIKESLHLRGVGRESSENPEEIEARARKSLEAAGRSPI